MPGYAREHQWQCKKLAGFCDFHDLIRLGQGAVRAAVGVGGLSGRQGGLWRGGQRERVRGLVNGLAVPDRPRLVALPPQAIPLVMQDALTLLRPRFLVHQERKIWSRLRSGS